MTLIAPPVRPCPVRATAERNFQGNCAALPFAPPPPSQDVEYLRGRDGALTALLPDGGWHGGCSLPRRAAEAMLKSFKPTGPVALFLAPPSAHAVAVVLEKLGPGQAVVALLCDAADLPVFLHCHDFSEAIGGRRLYFVCGPGWGAQLATLLAANPGLPTPTYLIKIAATDEIAAPLIAPAQKVIEQECARRERLVHEMRLAGIGDRGRSGLCLLAPQQFHLWSTPGRTLAGLFPGHTVFNPDEPCSSSPLGLATAAREARALVAANVARADLGPTLPDDLPWITWITTPRIPRFIPAAPRDAVLLADPDWRDEAVRSGWPEDRVVIATWPAPSVGAPPAARATPAIALIADTAAIPPAPAGDYSSHRLLWEAIRDELGDNPLLAYTDVHAYLTSRMSRLSIRADGFDRAAFLTQLIIPAYQQSLARLILRAKLPLKLYGAGWDALDEDLRPHARGAIRCEESFNAALGQTTLLVHPYPSRHLHPADFASVPNYRPASTSPNGYLQQLRAALAAPPRRPATAAISVERVESLLA